jgi:restriction system protein
MAAEEVTLWGIHAGKTGDADRLFLRRNYIAIGWARMGDLGALAPDREAFKTQLAEAYPDTKPGAIPVNAGQMYRFVHEMKEGDIAVYPSKRDRHVHL